MRIVDGQLGVIATCVAVALGPVAVAQAQGVDKYEKIAPSRPAPVKPAPATPAKLPAEPEGPAVTAATDPKLRAALAQVQTPLPESVSLRPPSAGDPAQLRAFYGVWTGKFEGGQTCTAIISIGGGNAMIIHSWSPFKKTAAGFLRMRGRFAEGMLKAKDEARAAAYRQLGGDSLELVWDTPRGTFRAVMKRIY